jgi:hypothetical protein
MRIRRVKSKGLVFSRLPASQVRLLQQIPVHADPAGSSGAEERLYQSPVRTVLDDTDDELVNDWNDHVLPDLRESFTRQLECVTEDLRAVRRERHLPPPAAEAVRESSTTREDEHEHEHEDEDEHEDEGLPAGEESYELVIPPEHIDAWYGALNQARLVMQERYKFPEVESLAAIVALLTSENLKPYLTSRFYTQIQAALLDLGMDVE